MEPRIALVKTEKGAQEIETRKHKLDHRMRALLLVVNGAKTADALAREFERFGDVRAMLEQLQREGFIKPALPLRELRLEAARMIYDALGPDSSAITQEVEDCPSVAELRRYLEARRSLFETALDKGRADRLWAKLQALLA